MKLIDPPNKSFMAKFDRHEPLIKDSTAMKYLKTCDRKFFYRIILGYEVRVQKYQVNLDWGNIRHKFREILEKTKDAQQAIAQAMKVKLTIPEQGHKYAFLNKERAMTMLATDYDVWEKEQKSGKIKVLPDSVEQPINIQLPDGTYSGGRIDQGVEWAGQIWDRDFKTSSKDISVFSKEKDPDDQATRYIYMLGELHGKPIGGVIFDVIQNAKTVHNKWYNHLVTKTPKQIAQWLKEQLHLNKQLELNREADIWPMREHNCAWCEYAMVCRKPNEQAQMAELESNYVKNPWDFTKVHEVD